jgi:hypothetical protein
MKPAQRRLGTVWWLVALLLPGSLLGQAPAWDIPHRGAHVFTRVTDQFDVSPPPSKLKADWLVADGAAETPQTWSFFAGPAQGLPDKFEQPTFDASSWPTGHGKFGTEVGSNQQQRSEWRSEALAVRTAVDLGQKKPRALWFVVDHDDGVRIWLNGKLLVADDGYGFGRSFFISGKALDAWQRGPNLLAARCVNTGGAQHFDLRLAAITDLPAGVRSMEQIQQALREDNEAANRVRSELFGEFRPPGLLLHGDLDAERQCVRLPPADLRELAWFAAMDLRPGAAGGAMKADLPRVYRVGDLQLRGRASPVDGEGWQQLELEVKSAPELAPRNDSKRFLDRHLRGQVWYSLQANLQVKRRLVTTPAGTRVVEFSSTLAGRVLRANNREPAASLHQREHWQLTQTHDNQDAAFRAKVTEAIVRGTERLREHLKQPTEDLLRAEPADGERSYHSGRLAIGLLALLKGGVPKDDEVVQRGLAELRQRALIDTYSLANAIMTLEALYIPPTESSDLRAGSIDRPRKRVLAAEDRALMQRWVDVLRDNIDTRVDPDALLRFNYIRGDRFDNSVNQYGLLGLYSAHLCGIEIKPITWEAAANHLLTCQIGDGQKVELDLVDYRTHARRQADPELKITGAKVPSRANGWWYHEGKDQGEWAPTRGSMTCAGITGLAICQAALQDHPNLKRPKLTAEATRARSDAFAWLALHMTPRYHPGEMAHQQQWFYYYLYGLERAALLSGVALIQDRDWYFEGAMVLILSQKADGNWPGEIHIDQLIERNAMAILFLKQSTLPVLTGK